MKTSKVVGIDLGTTNSVIAMMSPDNQTIACNTDSNGRRTTPSAIVWDTRSQSIKVGQPAFNRRGTIPEPITSIKRRMGDAAYRAELCKKALLKPEALETLEYEINNQTDACELAPVEVSAEILKELKNQMQEYLAKTPGCEDYVVDRAVITIPAYFRSEAAEATAKAGELAGLKVLMTLQEPSSSSAYYCWKNGVEDGIFMVYDLGGGTFDVSIVRYAAGQADVLGIAGNNYLGGDTFDELLANHLLEILQDDGYFLDLDVTNDEEDRKRFTKLKLAAEIIKKALSDNDEYYHTHDGLFTDQEGATVNLAVTITRDEFENLISPTLEGTIEKCQEALNEAAQKGVTLDMIDAVLLVGGSTHIPMVREFARSNFCDPSLPLHTMQPEPYHDDPDMAVGYGAAIVGTTFNEISFEDAPAETGEADSGGSEPVNRYAAEVNPAISIGGKSTVTGNITAVSGTLPQGAIARVTKADNSFTNEFPISAAEDGSSGSFKFSGLPAPSDNEPFNCVVEKDGSALISFNFNAGANLIASAPPVTLAHTLFVEIVDVNTGKLARRPLMEKGTNLPATRSHNFRTMNEYAATIAVYEDNTMLCNIEMTFESPIPVGSPVEVNLEIDERSTKRVTAIAAGKRETAVLESPPLERVAAEEIHAAMREFDEGIKMFPPVKEVLARAKRPQLDRLANDALQAVAEEDWVRARETFDELEGLVATLTRPSEIEPPSEKFEALAEKCDELNREFHDSNAENAAKINQYRTEGAAYYQQENQDGVTATYEALGKLKAVLEGDVPPPPAPPMWMLCQYMAMNTLESIRTAMERTDLPTAYKASFADEAGPDSGTATTIGGEMQPWTTDEEAVAGMTKIRPLMQKWEKRATEIIGISGGSSSNA